MDSIILDSHCPILDIDLSSMTSNGCSQCLGDWTSCLGETWQFTRPASFPHSLCVASAPDECSGPGQTKVLHMSHLVLPQKGRADFKVYEIVSLLSLLEMGLGQVSKRDYGSYMDQK